MLTRLLEASTCIEADLMKDIHWLCSRSMSSEGCMNLLIITDCL
jgi:hypothetical protein